MVVLAVLMVVAATPSLRIQNLIIIVMTAAVSSQQYAILTRPPRRSDRSLI